MYLGGIYYMSDNSLVDYVIDSDAKTVYKSLDVIRQKYYESNKRIKALEEENARLKSEHYKDEELNTLREKVSALENDIHRGFILSAEEVSKIAKWRMLHTKNVSLI